MPGILRIRRHPPEESVPVRVTTLVTVLLAVAAVASQAELARQAAMAGGAIMVGFWVSHRLRHARPVWLKLLIAVAVLLVARDFFLALLASPSDPRLPLVRLFLWLQVLHSFDLPARKDLMYSLASAVVLLAVAAVYARDVAFGTVLVLFAFAASATVVAMAAGQKVSLRWRTVATLGVVVGVGVLLSGALLFVAIPHGQGMRVRWLAVSPRLRLSMRLHTHILNPAYPEVAGKDPEQLPPIFNPQGYVGFSTYVDLRLRGVLDDTLVMRVRATRPALWRGLAFDEYTGRGWRMSDRSVEEYSSDQPRILPRLGPDEPWPAGSEQVIQTFFVEAPQPNVFFGAYRPFEIFVPTGSVAVDRYAALRSPVALEEGMIYTVISRVPAPTLALLRGDRGFVPPTIRDRYLQLPSIAPRIRALADQMTGGVRSPYDKAVAVNRFLVQHYSYNLQAPPLPDDADAVEEFLFVGRQGSCETFASAMAVLLRAAGVPARLVSGYTAGSYNVLTGYYEVRNSDAHAWVEVYVNDVGWIEFEPTPGFSTPEELAQRAPGQWLARDAVRWAVERLHSAARPVLGSLSHLRLNQAGGLLPSSGALAVLALTLALVRRRSVRPQAARHPGIAGMYAQMLRVLARKGAVRDPALTPREFAAGTPRQIRPLVFAITEAFEEHRYGAGQVTPLREAQTRQALVALRRLLRTLARKTS